MTLPRCITLDDIHNHVMSKTTDGRKSRNSTCSKCGLSIAYNRNGTIDYSSPNITNNPHHQTIFTNMEGCRTGTHDLNPNQYPQFEGTIKFGCSYCDQHILLGRHIEYHL